MARCQVELELRQPNPDCLQGEFVHDAGMVESYRNGKLIIRSSSASCSHSEASRGKCNEPALPEESAYHSPRLMKVLRPRSYIRPLGRYIRPLGRQGRPSVACQARSTDPEVAGVSAAQFDKCRQSHRRVEGHLASPPPL